MAAGWPEGTPLRRGLTFTYNHVQALQFLRTTYKAGPLVALGLAVLGGRGAVARRWRGSPSSCAGARAAGAPSPPRSSRSRRWPLVTGNARRAPARVQACPRRGSSSRPISTAAATARARWSSPDSSSPSSAGAARSTTSCPALTDHPVATRYIVPFSDLRSVDLQWAVDDLVGQERALPGQLRPLLDLMARRRPRRQRRRRPPPRRRPGACSRRRPSSTPACSTRPARRPTGRARRVRARGRPDRHAAAPAASCAARRARPTGGHRARAAARAGDDRRRRRRRASPTWRRYGALPRRPAAALRGRPHAAARCAPRGRGRRDDRHQRLQPAPGVRRGAAAQNRGAVLPADQDISAGRHDTSTRSTAGPDAQTVAVQRGAGADARRRSRRRSTQFPEHRPFAAIDGDLSTAWLADRYPGAAAPPPRPRRSTPARRARTSTCSRTPTAARDHAQRDRQRAALRRSTAAGTGCRLGIAARGQLHDRAVRDQAAEDAAARAAAASASCACPGVKVDELLRPPVLAEQALRGADLGKTRLDVPVRSLHGGRARAARPPLGARAGAGPGARRAATPSRSWRGRSSRRAARRWSADAWVHADATAPDHALDRLVGTHRAGHRRRRPARFENRPGYRASSAFDGDARRHGSGQWIAGKPAWLSWTTRRPVAVHAPAARAGAVRRAPPDGRARCNGGQDRGPVRRRRDRDVAAPVRGRRFRLDVVDARSRAAPRRACASAAPSRSPSCAAPGLRLVGAAARATAAGRRAAAPRSARRGRDAGAARHGRRRAAFDAGRAAAGARLRRRSRCPASRFDVRGLPPTFVVDHLRLGSPRRRAGSCSRARAGACCARARAATAAATACASSVDGPSWLVLGESFNKGWRARCNGKDLGAPRPIEGYANGWLVDRGCATRRLPLRAEQHAAPRLRAQHLRHSSCSSVVAAPPRGGPATRACSRCRTPTRCAAAGPRSRRPASACDRPGDRLRVRAARRRRRVPDRRAAALARHPRAAR